MPPTARPALRPGFAPPLALSLLLLLSGAAAPPPARAQVPGPEEVIGFSLGSDYRLADYGQVLEYVRALDAASDRIVLERIGTSTLGRPLVLAYVSTPENLARRERIAEINRRLALARDLEPDEARALAREGMATVWIDGGLHANEVAHSQHLPELAHWLVSSESDEARRIRENVMTLLMININPDGLDIITGWYRSNLGTPYETAELPGLYHHYVGHDNNRDWYMFTQAETKAAARIFYHEWFPQVIYNHHQTGPFPGRIWVPPAADPLSPVLDPMMAAKFSHVGQYMLKRFMAENKPGVSTGIGYRVTWGGGFMHYAPQLHNLMGMFTETALYRYATPHCYSRAEVGDTFTRGIDLPTDEPSMKYPEPWMGGCWRIRDAMDYMMTASRAVLDLASKTPEDFLYDVYHLGRRQISRGEAAEEGPFAWIVDPADQHDPSAAVELLQVLRTGGVEIHRAERAFRAGGEEHPAGSYVIGPQAFRAFVVDLLEPKLYPDRFDHPGGPPESPYDFTGYNLPDQMGVDVTRVHEPFAVPGSTVEEVRPEPGAVSGGGEAGYLLTTRANHAFRAVNRLLEDGATVDRLGRQAELGGRTWAPGTFRVRDVERSRLEEEARATGLDFVGIDDAPADAFRAVSAPRVGLYKSWVASMPEGWTRWVLDQYGFRADTLHDGDLTPERLSGYDVLVLPDQGAETLANGHPPGTMPERYVGGIGAEGAAALKGFVERGGWLLGVHRSAGFAARTLGLPVTNRIEGVDPRRFYVPGSLIRIEPDPAEPVSWGMDPDATALFWRHSWLPGIVSPASEASSRDGERRAEHRLSVVATFDDEDVLADGWAIGGDEHLAGKPAALRMPLGDGQVVLLGFRPDTRGQPRSTFKLLFNALLGSTMEGVETPTWAPEQ